MLGVVIFLTLMIMSVIVLLVTAIPAVIGSLKTLDIVELASSSQYFTIASALAFSGMAILIIMLIAGAITGDYMVDDYIYTVNKKANPSDEEIRLLEYSERTLASTKYIQYIVLAILVIIAVMALIAGIMGTLAALDIGYSSVYADGDPNAIDAYTQAVIVAISGFIAFGTVGLASLTYLFIRVLRKSSIQLTQRVVQRYSVSVGQPIIRQEELPQQQYIDQTLISV